MLPPPNPAALIMARQKIPANRVPEMPTQEELDRALKILDTIDQIRTRARIQRTEQAEASTIPVQR